MTSKLATWANLRLELDRAAIRNDFLAPQPVEPRAAVAEYLTANDARRDQGNEDNKQAVAPHGFGDGVAQPGRSEFALGPRDVLLDAGNGNVEPPRDLALGFVILEQPQHVALARAELRVGVRAGAVKLLDAPGGSIGGNPQRGPCFLVQPQRLRRPEHDMPMIKNGDVDEVADTMLMQQL